MGKRLESKYLPGKRSRDWLKFKTHGEQEFVIAGYTKGKGRREWSFGSLVLATNGPEGLEWVGNVGTGFDDDEQERLLKKLKPLERKTSPFPQPPKMPRIRKGDVVWVEPKLVAEVSFAEFTHDGRLRAPVYLGLRDDKDATEVRREMAEADPGRDPQGQARAAALEPRQAVLAGRGDHEGRPARVLPRRGAGARAAPARPAVHDAPLPGRGVRQVVLPEGQAAGDARLDPDGEIEVSTREKPRQRRKIDAPLVNDELALLWMVNMGCIDLNTWYSRVDKLDRPDFVLFDLDPSPDVGFRETVQVALLVKEALDALGLESFPKTSGADGMHVLVPIARRHTYDDTRQFAEIVAGALASTHRGLVTTEWTKSKRKGVLIDANQNGEGKTIASVYSVRPKEGAPVSTPLRWDGGRRVARPGAPSRWRPSAAAWPSTATCTRACSTRSSRSRPLYAVCASGYAPTVRCFGKGGAT